MADQICHDCGKVYDGAGQGRYCHTCRKERLKAAAKARDLSSIGRKAYSKQLEMRKATDKTESCGNCEHLGKDSHFCRNTDSKCWGSRVADSWWCSKWGKADGPKEIRIDKISPFEVGDTIRIPLHKDKKIMNYQGEEIDFGYEAED